MRAVSSLIRWSVGLPYSLLVMSFLFLASYVVPLPRLHPVIRVLFRSMLWIFGLRVEVEGLDQIDPTRGYLYMSNHVNLFEPFVVAAYFPQWVVGVEKRANFKIPVYGPLIRRWGNIAIDRDNTASAIQSLERGKAALAQGICVQLMPEGTRTKDGSLGPFKKGGFHLALDTGAAIAPYAYQGMFDFYKTGSWLLTPTTLRVVFRAPIETAGLTRADLPELMTRVRDEIAGALEPGLARIVPADPAPSATI
ncbi:MAG TPA: lysophospholipid acyltransferase family protein [Oscillatoriaceae cyanobacterium]